MAELTALLVVTQALGAVVGAVTAVWGEVAYVHALRDGILNKAERRHLEVISHGLRFGMLLLLLSSLGLVIVSYVAETSSAPAFTMSYWLFVVLVVAIIGASWALSRKRIMFSWGSAIVFSAWWVLVLLTLGQLPVNSLLSGLAFFVLALVLFGLVLYAGRSLATFAVKPR
jgi:hypothetical protein